MGSKRTTAWVAVGWAVVAIASGRSSAWAAPSEATPIWRAQVRFITADVTDAGTDDSVKVELNAGNSTWLDSGRDDREPGQDEKYDLRLPNVSRLSDINYFRIEKTGSGGWGIRKMFFIINEQVIYEADFPEVLWLDNSGGHSRVYYVDGSLLRSGPLWSSYVAPVRPNIVTRAAMARRMEAIAGDFATQRDLELRRGNNAASPNTISTDTWYVDLAMAESAEPLGQNISTDFNLRVSCASVGGVGRPKFAASNVHASASFEPWVSGLDDVREFLSGDFSVQLQDMMKNFTFLSLCPTIVLAPHGDLYFNPTDIPLLEAPPFEVADNSPLDVHVIDTDAIAAFKATSFAIATRSQLDKDAPVEVSFDLPTQVTAVDSIVEVQQGRSVRTINAKLTNNADGTSSLAFRDVITAAGTPQYTLHLLFQPRQDARQQLAINIKPASAELATLITPLAAVSHFAFAGGAIVPRGTVVRRASYRSK